MPYASQKTGGVYADLSLYLPSQLPSDLVEISQDEYLKRAGTAIPEESVTQRPVSMYQLRMALIDEGKSDAVELGISELPSGKTKQKTLAAWQTAGSVERNSDFANTLAGILDWSEPQMNELFKRAAKVQ